MAAELGIRKIVLVQPEDFFAMVAIEAAFDQMSERPYQFAFFASETLAKNWLMAAQLTATESLAA